MTIGTTKLFGEQRSRECRGGSAFPCPQCGSGSMVIDSRAVIDRGTYPIDDDATD